MGPYEYDNTITMSNMTVIQNIILIIIKIFLKLKYKVALKDTGIILILLLFLF